MGFVDLVKLGLTVAGQKEVIIALVAAIIFIALANYVIRYRKKPPHVKKRAEKSKPDAKPQAGAPAGEAAAAEGNPSAQG